MIQKDNLEEYLWNYFEGKASSSDIKMINSWLDESKENESAFTAIKKTYIEIESIARKKNEVTQEAYDKFLSRIDKSVEIHSDTRRVTGIKFHNFYFRYALIAAVVILMAVSTYLIIARTHSVTTDTFAEIVVPYGGRSSLILPDGSKIWLNAGSRFKYYRTYDIKSREVFLDGEAYFDVEKSKHPFIVHTSHIDIIVLGTTFNVKSYSEDENIETTLVEGKIQIERKESDQPLYLKPRQKLIYHKTSNSFQAEQIITDNQTEVKTKVDEAKENIATQNIDIEANINTDESTSWKDGKLIFNNEPLVELVKKLERKYDIVFKFNNEELKKYSYSGTLRDFPLEQVLKALELTSPIKYSISEKTVTLDYNKQFKPSTKIR
jgi:ferric-dicitrate binding protein FerR (iron transport regulator)